MMHLFQDELQLRHKTLPIPICVNLCEGDDRKIEVNSGFPLMDIVPSICKDIGRCGRYRRGLGLARLGRGIYCRVCLASSPGLYFSFTLGRGK